HRGSRLLQLGEPAHALPRGARGPREEAVMSRPQLGFFTRVLDDAPPAERYRLALEQVRAAEAAGFDAVAVAQHHLDGREGGLPSPLVLLAHAAALTSRVRLTTGVVTLALEDPVRVAEDATVLDHLSGGRVELGL